MCLFKPCAFRSYKLSSDYCFLLCSIDGCIDFDVDFTNPFYNERPIDQFDENSIKRVIVRSGEGAQHNPSEPLTIGQTATIIATGEYNIIGQYNMCYNDY